MINTVITTSYIHVTLSTGASNVTTTSVLTMNLKLKYTNFEGGKIAFKLSYDRQDLTLMTILY